MKSKRITTSCLFLLIFSAQFLICFMPRIIAKFGIDVFYSRSYLEFYGLFFFGEQEIITLYFLCAIIFLVLLCVRKYRVLFLSSICAWNVVQIYESCVIVLRIVQESKSLNTYALSKFLYIGCNLMLIALSVISVVPQMNKLKKKIHFLFTFPAIMKFIGHLNCVFLYKLKFIDEFASIIALIDILAIFFFCNYLKSYYKIYEVDGGISKRLQIYDDKCVIIEFPYKEYSKKNIYYKDIDGIKYDIKSDVFNGLLLLKTKSLNIAESFFVFDKTKISIKKMNEIVSYIKKKSDCQEDNFATTGQSISYSDNKEMNILDMINAEKRMRCSVCGHIFCYNALDVEKNRKNEEQVKWYAISGALNAIFGTLHNSYLNTSEAQKYRDKIVDFSRCPKCNSTQLEDITNKKLSEQKSLSTNERNSSADELKKFKELLDSRVITQEEFEAKKKQILGL